MCCISHCCTAGPLGLVAGLQAGALVTALSGGALGYMAGGKLSGWVYSKDDGQSAHTAAVNTPDTAAASAPAAATHTAAPPSAAALQRASPRHPPPGLTFAAAASSVVSSSSAPIEITASGSPAPSQKATSYRHSLWPFARK